MNSYARATSVVAAFWLLPVGYVSAHETKSVLGQALIVDSRAGQIPRLDLKVGVVDMEKVHAEYRKFGSAGEKVKSPKNSAGGDARIRDFVEKLRKFKIETNDNKGAPKP